MSEGGRSLPPRALERALFAGRVAVAAATLGLGFAFASAPRELVAGLAGAIIAVGALLYLLARWGERASEGLEAARGERALAVAGVVLDAVLVAAALAIFAADPDWNATVLVPLAVLVAAFRVGPLGALASLAMCGVAYAAIGWWRAGALGAPFAPLALAPRLVLYAAGAALAWGIARAVVERLASAERALEDLRRRTMRDPVTGLGNRAFTIERLELAIAMAKRFGGGVGLVLMDLHDFKSVNDTFGQPTGDAVLKMIGDRLRPLLRSTDGVARVGGDDFAVILPRSDRAGAVSVAQKILAWLEQPLALLGVSIALRASLGVVAYPEDGEDADTLVRHAEAALDAAKAQAGGYATFTAGQEQQTAWGGMLLADLREALARDQLIPYFQPIVSCRDGQLLSVEALVRWQHPRRGLVGPGEFVAYAEQVGLDTAMFERMLHTSLAQLRAWRATGLSVVASVNLSARNLLDPGLVPTLERALAAEQAEPSWLELEITETMVLVDRDRAKAVIAGLRRMGFRVAIDDFGTGYSSLRYLQGLECDSLKIDQTFVRGMTSDPASATIVRASIDLGHALGMRATAEGIEDLQTLQRLAQMGCDKAQGYLIAKPMPGADLPVWHAALLARMAARVAPRQLTPV